MKQQLHSTAYEAGRKIIRDTVKENGPAPEGSICSGCAKGVYEVPAILRDYSGELMCRNCTELNLEECENRWESVTENALTNAGCFTKYSHPRLYKIVNRGVFAGISAELKLMETKQAIIREASKVLSSVFEIINKVEADSDSKNYLGHSDWFCTGYPFGGDLNEFAYSLGDWILNLTK